MLSPAPENKILRRMSYISDQVGILNRYAREQEGWDDHINNSVRFINEVLNEFAASQIVVLGSGWLLDFPLDRIASSGAKIILVDVCFPPQLIRKIQNFDNVKCLRADITGGYIKSVYEQVKKNKGDFYIPAEIPLPNIKPEEGKLLISLNILNQLDILLVDYIKRNLNSDEMVILEFRKLLQESHINMLKKHPFILVTDCTEIIINKGGQKVGEKELIFTSLPEGEKSHNWEWQFDTHGLYNSHADTHMKVKSVFSKPN